MMFISGCALRPSKLSDTSGVPAGAQVATMWGVPFDAPWGRHGMLAFDGADVAEIKELGDAILYATVEADDDGNVAFADKNNIYVMNRTGTRINPRHDTLAKTSGFATGIPLGHGEFAMLSNYGDDASSPSGYTFLLEYTDGTAIHVPYWVAGMTQCDGALYGLSWGDTSRDNSRTVRLLRVDRTHRTITEVGSPMSGPGGLSPVHGLACQGHTLVARFIANSWNKKSTWSPMTLAVIDVRTGAARQLDMKDAGGQVVHANPGVSSRDESSAGTSDMVIKGDDAIWASRTGRIWATSMTTGVTRMLFNGWAAYSTCHAVRIRGNTVGVYDQPDGNPRIRLYDFTTGKLRTTLEAKATHKVHEDAGGWFSSLTPSGFALLPGH